MCIYANAFVAGRKEDDIVIPASPPRLQATLDGELHPLFIDQFKDTEGIVLVLHDGHCLCQYKDWGRFFEYIEKIRQVNDVDRIPVMVFGTSHDYPTVNKIHFDIELDEITERPTMGTIMFVGISVGRRLEKNIGNQVSLLFKNGKTMTGDLKEYKSEEEYGEIVVNGSLIYFNADEIRHVDSIV